MPQIPFGKYRGYELEDLPDSYLFWLHGRNLREPLRTYVNIEYECRCRAENERPSLPIVDARVLKTAREIVQAGYRVLAAKCHPDRGGDHDEMINVNAAVEWLRAELDRGE